ncbi:hypothetical protein ACFY04_18380 [Streptomyces sp. NPDC001549]|uniref:hypothetical protein n=1 Tax=Streptomyces sp. NPDC001549 TaxID=3364586 RepID=UPI0036926FBF
MATGERDLADGIRQETELPQRKPTGAWSGINAFFTGAGRRNWQVNLERRVYILRCTVSL